MTTLRFPIILAGIALSLAGAATAAPRSRADDIAALRKHEERVTAIGERLSAAAAAAGWCDEGYSLGWTLGDLAQYPKQFRFDARNEWNVPTGANLFVSAVAPGSVAARAGITPGMGIISIAGRRPLRMQTEFATRYPLTNSERIIDDALEEGPLQFETLSADGTRRSWTLTAASACPTRFQAAADEQEQAYADGELVVVTAGMSDFTEESDAELAAVIAHELAHNILRHVDRQRDAGTPNNYRRYLGRYTRISRKMEEEADRLSVWLLAVSGYDPRTPVTFWQRFGPDHDGAHPLGRLHDPWETRVASIENELALMTAQRRANPRARPALLDRRNEVPQAAAAGGASATPL